MNSVKVRTNIFSLAIVLCFMFSLTSGVSAQVVDVAIIDFSFNPSNITIDVGTTVRWTNQDGVAHTSTADGTWDSGSLANGETFEYTFNSSGTFNYICSIHPVMTGSVTVQQPTDIENEGKSQMPDDFNLGRNYPNPFNPSTNISFSLARRAAVTLEVYSILGMKIKTLADREFPAGNHTLVWDGTDRDGRQASSGIYFYSMEADEFRATEKMVLLK